MLAGLLLLIGQASNLRAQNADSAVDLNTEVVRLYQAGQYAEASRVAKRLVAILEKALGPEHPDSRECLHVARGSHRTDPEAIAIRMRP
jgi:hypothetical protein